MGHLLCFVLKDMISWPQNQSLISLFHRRLRRSCEVSRTLYTSVVLHMDLVATSPFELLVWNPWRAVQVNTGHQRHRLGDSLIVSLWRVVHDALDGLWVLDKPSRVPSRVFWHWCIYYNSYKKEIRLTNERFELSK